MRLGLLLLIVSCVFGASLGLNYTITDVNTKAIYNESFNYIISFSNNEADDVSVYINKIFITRMFPMSTVNPSINIDIPAGETRTANLTIQIGNAPRGLYWIPLLISYNNITDQVFLEGEVVFGAADVRNLTIITPESTLPTEPFKLSMLVVSSIDNLNPVVSTIITDDSSVVYNTTSIDMLSKGINIVDKEIKLPNNTKPGVYRILVQLELSNMVVAEAVATINVNSYSKLDYSENITVDLFGSQVIKVYDNSGTESVTVNVNQTLSMLEPLLVTKRLILISEGGVSVNYSTPYIYNNYISENVTLQPGQSAELIVQVNYSSLLVLPFFVLLCAVAYLIFTRRVTLRKDIIECKREEGELMIKVGISVRNVSGHSISDVRIIEDLPVYAKKAGGFGSIHGDIDKEKGTITFTPGRLDPKEEVLITYKFKTDVELEGRVSLPPATAKFSAKGKMNIIKSGTPTIQLIKLGEPAK